MAYLLDAHLPDQRKPIERSQPAELSRLLLTRASAAQLAPALLVSENISIGACVHLMKARHVSCVLVSDSSGDLAIVTRTDLLYALALEQRWPDEPIAPLKRSPLIAVESHEVLFQALLRMTSHRVERVVVREGTRILGTLGLSEVLSHYSSQAQLIGLHLERAESIAEISAAARGLTDVLANLHAQGVHMSYLMDLLSALNSRLMGALFDALVPAAVRSKLCLLVLGSEGRSEQLMKTDQDNALILADDLDWPQIEQVCGEFSAALQDLGYPPCPGKVMVNNSAWRLRQSEWMARVTDWSQNYDGSALLELAICLDARPIAGNAALFGPLQSQLLSLAGNAGLLRQLAAPVLGFATPLTLFGKLKAGEFGLDIKKGGIFPIVHGLRVLALQAGIADTNSFRRAEQLVGIGVMHRHDADDLLQALSVFLRLRLGDQLRKLNADQPFDNQIDVKALRKLDRQLLREALHVVNQFKDFIAARFSLI